MEPLSIIALAAKGAQAIGGAIQGIGGRQRQKDLWRNRPNLGVTQGETANDSLYGQMANATEMPGQSQFEDKLGQTYAEGVYDSQKTAISSLGANQNAVDLASKKMDAVRDLAGAFAEWKSQRQEALAGWNREKTQLEQQRFDVNQMQPWGIKMNEAVSQKQSGWNSFGSAIDSGLGMAVDLQGTQQMIEMYKSLYPK